MVKTQFKGFGAAWYYFFQDKGMDRKQKKVFQERLFRQQRGKCAYCNDAVKFSSCSRQEPKTATLDHVVPVSKGGRTSWINLVLACHACNQAKADSFWEPRYGNTLACRHYLSLRMKKLAQATPPRQAVIMAEAPA